MPVIHTPDTPYAKEMARHEAIHTKYGAPGRPYQFADYPTMMYRAVRTHAGPPDYEGEIANDPQEQARLEYLGYVHGGKGAAFAKFERDQAEHGKLAAERNYEVATGKLSEKAIEEVKFVEEAAGAMHVPEIPEGRKRGRPKKIQVG